MPQTTINFTVSMWNRMPHLVTLLDNLYEIVQVDPDIALHVCAFEGEDATFSELRQAINGAPCPATLTYRTDEFGNGLGHNIVSGGIELDELICHVTVDICMPTDITQRIRDHTEDGKAIYYPRMYQQCKDGRLATRGDGGALIALYKRDWLKTGGLQPQRIPWGGDNKISGAEDIFFEKTIRELKYCVNRRKEEDLYCRWHLRHLANPFYRTLRGKNPGNTVPWMNLVSADGKEL
jgi:hypothetical protein